MLAAWAKETEGNIFPLWSRTTFKLTFDESVNKRHWSGLYGTKSLLTSVISWKLPLDYTKCNFFFQAVGKMFRSVKHSSTITDRLACSYPAYECSGQRVEGYEYCIRHILEDKSAPYRPCGYVYSGNGRRCVMPTPKADKRETGYILLEASCSIDWPQWIQSAMKEETTAVDCCQVCLHWAPTTATLKVLCLTCIENIPTVVSLYYSRALLD
jgi:hypothetical protein